MPSLMLRASAQLPGPLPSASCCQPLPPVCPSLCPSLLAQRMAKSSEKPRLRQIPSSEDMEAEGTLPEPGADSSNPAVPHLEPSRLGSSLKEPERMQKVMQPQEELILQQVPRGGQRLGAASRGGQLLAGHREVVGQWFGCAKLCGALRAI